MQYAQVLVNTKSDTINKTYTYLIPASILPKITVGCLVSVPFGRKNKEGIIYNIVRTVPKVYKSKLKEINFLIYPFPVISLYQLHIAQKVSKYYLANLSQVVFFMLPNITKRKNDNIVVYQKQFVDEHKKEQIYALYERREYRIGHYIKLIDKAIKCNKSAIVLFPDFIANNSAVEKIKKAFGDTVIVMNPKANILTQTNDFLKLYDNKPVVLIGTRNTILQHINNPGLIIIDDFMHFGYKEEQNIHYNSLKVARFISETTGAKIVLGDSYNFTVLQDFPIKILCNNDYIKNLCIKNFNTSLDKNNIIGYNLELFIQKVLIKKENILLITNQNATASGIICQDCKNIFYCPRCNQLLRLKDTNDKHLECSICNYKLPIPDKCGKCGSTKLVKFGNTSHKINEIIHKLFPKCKTKILKTDNDYNNKYDKDVRIFISNNYASSWNELQFDNTAFLSFENMKINPVFNTNINLLKNVIKFVEITKKVLIIQHSSEDDLLLDIVQKNISNVIASEAKMYKKFGYPPYKKYIKFIFRDTDEKQCTNQINKLQRKLNQTLPNNILTRTLPIGKNRNKYIGTLLISAESYNYKNLILFLNNNYKILNLSHYIVDVEPIKLI